MKTRRFAVVELMKWVFDAGYDVGWDRVSRAPTTSEHGAEGRKRREDDSKAASLRAARATNED